MKWLPAANYRNSFRLVIGIPSSFDVIITIVIIIIIMIVILSIIVIIIIIIY